MHYLISWMLFVYPCLYSKIFIEKKQKKTLLLNSLLYVCLRLCNLSTPTPPKRTQTKQNKKRTKKKKKKEIERKEKRKQKYIIICYIQKSHVAGQLSLYNPMTHTLYCPISPLHPHTISKTVC